MNPKKEIPEEVLDILVPFKGHKPYSCLGDTTVERRIKELTFPQPVRLGPGSRAFRVRDLREWQKDPMNYKAKP